MRYLLLSCMVALLLLLGVLLVVTPARADATITVTTTSDVIAADGECSLREAVIAANTDGGFSDCPAGAGADTIVFDGGLPQPAVFVLTNAGANEDDALTGDLDISGTLAISSTGITIIDGNDTDRVFQVLPGARATMDGVTIRHGNPGSADGGGVVIDLTGRLTLSNTSVISNTAVGGGGIKVLGALTMDESTVAGNQGGGIRSDGGLLTLTNVDIIDNRGGFGIHNQNQAPFTFSGGLVSGNQGGGIYNATSSATLSDLAIVDNAGSGVSNSGATLSHLTIQRSAVMSNTATEGAGILNQGVGAIANIYDTRISGNSATAAGGGIFNAGILSLNRSVIDHNEARSGGGIDHFGGNLSLINDTLSYNAAADNGGGLHGRANAIVTNVTFESNSANGPETGGNIFNDEAQISLRNTIVAHADTDGNCFNSNGSLNSLGDNLDDGKTCGFSATGDITNTDPFLGPLQDNGGDTLTHALLPGSPAIDTGDADGCPVTDQRGIPRPQGAGCDIGAYEFGAAADLSIKKLRQGSGAVTAGERVTYTITITNAGPTAPVTAIVVDSWSPAGAVVGVDAPGCTIDHAGGVITCTRSNLGIGTAVLPDPYVVFTTSIAFSGTLTNTASVTTTGGVVDSVPDNNVSAPVLVTVESPYVYTLFLPLELR